MVTESRFVKLPLKDGDTIESVAKDLNVNIELVMLMHNHEAIMFDKIKSRYEGFPEHLTEIFVTKETIDQVEESKQIKADYAFFADKFYEKRTYGFSLENFENDVLKTKIHYEVDMVYVRNQYNQNILEVNRKQVYINNKEPEILIEQLANKIAETIFPIQVKLSGQGEIVAITNHDDVKKRWAKKQEDLLEYYEGDLSDKIIAKANICYTNDGFLLDSLSKNWFFNLFFKPIYGSYTPLREIKYNTEFPVNGNNTTEFEITQTVEKVYTKNNKLVIYAVGNNTENNIAQQETNYKTTIQYKLNGSDNTKNSINGLFTATNNNQTTKIEVEIIQL